jgi:LacI family transcriptional regulator, galactose operon repressor
VTPGEAANPVRSQAGWMPWQVRRPTLADVAREAGVSIKTVSRVVNNEPTVQPEYVERVSTAIAKVGFRRNDSARNLRTGAKTSTIGLVIGDVRNPFYSVITRVIEQVAWTHDTLLLTCNTEEDPDREKELIQELCQRRVDGLVVVPTYGDHSYCRAEIEMGTPMVFIDRRPAGVQADTVLIDNVHGARHATEHLLSLGHGAIAVIGQDLRTFTMAERQAGFRAAMDHAGVAVDPSLLRFGPVTPREAAEAASSLLALSNAPTAFLCYTNRSTIGVVEELWRRGLRAAVAGFDDIEQPALLPIPVALVVYDIEQIGRRSAELLFRRIRGHRGGPQEVTVATRLIVRGGQVPWEPATV